MIYNLGLLEQKFSKQNETLADNSNDSLAILAKQFEKEQKWSQLLKTVNEELEGELNEKKYPSNEWKLRPVF